VAFVRGDQGAIVGLVLHDGAQVRVSRVASARLRELRHGDVVWVEGLGRRGSRGLGLAAQAIRDAAGRVVIAR
jgi:hypothetical protein